jgi:hypothetical protein
LDFIVSLVFQFVFRKEGQLEPLHSRSVRAGVFPSEAVVPIRARDELHIDAPTALNERLPSAANLAQETNPRFHDRFLPARETRRRK